MRLALYTLCLLMATGSFAYDLSPGNAFPKLVLPTIEGGESLSIEKFEGERVVLHLFAAW